MLLEHLPNRIEYWALADAAAEIIWLRSLITLMGIRFTLSLAAYRVQFGILDIQIYNI